MNRIIVLILAFCSISGMYAQTDNITRKRSKQAAELSSINHSSSNSLGKQNGYEWVDLGLSVKWATCNVGSSSPTDFGSFYSWGDVKTRKVYDKNYSYDYDYGEWADNLANQVINHQIVKKPALDYDIQSSRDIATIMWGKGWRMPTKTEFDELKNKCRWTWKGNGYEVKAFNGNSIFLPASGWMYEDVCIDKENLGVYWTSTRIDKSIYFVYNFSFHESNIKFNEADICYGHNVRPVTK